MVPPESGSIVKVSSTYSHTGAAAASICVASKPQLMVSLNRTTGTGEGKAGLLATIALLQPTE